jgi:hypothetical protein
MNDDRDLDQKVRTWLDEPPPGPPDRDAVYARVVDRLPETHQRRHWWPTGWNPFAASATRSAEAGGRRRERRATIMLYALSSTALVIVLGLAGGLALLTGSGPAADDHPGATSTTPMAPERFEGTMIWGVDGEQPGVDEGDMRVGRIGLMRPIDIDDPRFAGSARFIHDARDAGGMGPEWGTYRFETEDGAWEGTLTGVFDEHETRLAGWLQGEGAYAGNSQYLSMWFDHAAATPAEVIAFIVPGEPPADPPTFD